MLCAVAAFPNYFFTQRGPYAKEGWDYSQVADLIGSHAAPGDCLLVDNTVVWKPGPIRALLATRPAAFRSVIDVERGFYGPKVGALWDGHVAVWLTTAKINKCPDAVDDHQPRHVTAGPSSGTIVTAGIRVRTRARLPVPELPRVPDRGALAVPLLAGDQVDAVTRRLNAPAVGSLTGMQTWLADPLFGGAAQNGRHLIELFAAFALTTLIGLERTIQGKSAGLRTQTIVGTSSALVLLISKYGFGDVLTGNTVVLDPSRVAAQIVSGIGFLGAGIIITRRGAVHGLTTAAAVWESAAIGMAAGAGLLLLAIAVVALHFVSALAFNVVERQLTARLRGTVRLHIVYENGRGVLREVLRICGQRNWQLTELDADAHDIDDGEVGVTMTLSGSKMANAQDVFSGVDGVIAVLRAEDEAGLSSTPVAAGA